MMKGFVVVITAALTIIFLKKKQFAHHFLGIFLVISGIAVVGISSCLQAESSKTEEG
jgi:uncharacterized membrane protein